MSNVDCTRTADDRKTYFTQVPDALAEDPRLLPRDLTTVVSILKFARSNKPWASMCNATLANMGRCQERTIQYSLKRLERTGWIRRVETDARIGSAARRLIYLTWREPAPNFTPPLSAVASPPVQPVAPEPESQENKTRPAVMGSGSPRPEPPKTSRLASPGTASMAARTRARARPAPPSSAIPSRYPTYRAAEPMPADPDLFRDWLARPIGDTLRSMAERALEGKLVESALRQPGTKPLHGSRARTEDRARSPR